MFEVKQTEEMLNKTFRLPASLLDELASLWRFAAGQTGLIPYGDVGDGLPSHLQSASDDFPLLE